MRAVGVGTTLGANEDSPQDTGFQLSPVEL